MITRKVGGQFKWISMSVTKEKIIYNRNFFLSAHPQIPWVVLKILEVISDQHFEPHLRITTKKPAWKSIFFDSEFVCNLFSY